MSEHFFKRVYQVVMKIPIGSVVTYGQVARALGSPKSARIVGWALHVNPDKTTIPCHRVVNSKGMISSGFVFGGPDAQRTLLEAEGIVFDENGRIDLEVFGYDCTKC